MVVDALQAATPVEPDGSALDRAIEIIEMATELVLAVERAIAGQQLAQIDGFLSRRQALLEELVDLTRQGVRLDHPHVRPSWMRLQVQDRVTQDNLLTAMRSAQKKLSRVRRSLNTTTAYGERPPRTRASLVDLRG